MHDRPSRRQFVQGKPVIEPSQRTLREWQRAQARAARLERALGSFLGGDDMVVVDGVRIKTKNWEWKLRRGGQTPREE